MATRQANGHGKRHTSAHELMSAGEPEQDDLMI